MEIKALIKKAGGYMQVAVALELSESAVKRWAHLGIIPERYWPHFIRHPACNVSAETLHQINEKGRRKRA